MRIAILVVIAMHAGNAWAGRLIPGHVLVVNGYQRQLQEYTTEGELVQTIDIPRPDHWRRTLGDVVVDSVGRIHVATIPPYRHVHSYLSTFDPNLDEWTHLEIPPERFSNRLNREDRVSIRDDLVLARGVIIDLSTMEFRRYQDWYRGGVTPILGPDGLMYAVNGGSPQAHLRRKLPFNYSHPDFGYDEIILRDSDGRRPHIFGLAFSSTNDLLAADAHGSLYSYGPDFRLNHQIDTGLWRLQDIEISESGVVVATNRSGEIVFSNAKLESFRVQQIGRSSDPLFVTFVPTLIPEPESASLSLCAMLCLAFSAVRRRAA